MSFTRPQATRSAPHPTPPTGNQIAAYGTYAEAQQAVHFLNTEHFPVEHLTIVGNNLQSVERVTGRLSYGRVAIAGAMSGGWFGLFVGLLLSLFGGVGVTSGITFIAIALGAGFGLLFSVLSYSFARGRRDFTSSTQIVAGSYVVLCAAEQADVALRLLARSPVGIGSRGATVGAGTDGVRQQPTSNITAPVVVAVTDLTGNSEAATNSPTEAGVPRKIDPRWVTEDGRPKYGAMVADDPNAVVPVVAPIVLPEEGATAGGSVIMREGSADSVNQKIASHGGATADKEPTSAGEPRVSVAQVVESGKNGDSDPTALGGQSALAATPKPANPRPATPKPANPFAPPPKNR